MRRGEDRGGQRSGQLARPRLPRRPGEQDPVAPRHGFLPVGEGTTSAHDSGQNTLVTQHALHAGETVVDAFIRPGTKQADLVIADGIHAFRHDSNSTDGGVKP